MKVIYTSLWDDAVEVATYCDYDPLTRLVTNIECVDVEGVDILTEQSIFVSGDTIKCLTFDEFQTLWIETETNCDNDDDKEQLVEELSNAQDFESLFDVIKMWTHTPLNERLTKFLTKNNCCVCIEN